MTSILQKENEDLQVRIEELLEINDTHRQLNGELRKELQIGENFMTSVLKADDWIFTMYRQYKELIHKDAEESGNFVYGIDQLAVQLTVAHMVDHVVCLFKEGKPPTAREGNREWEKVRMSPLMKTAGEEELEIMRNNAELKSSSASDGLSWSAAFSNG